MNQYRQEKFKLQFGDALLKPIDGFSDGKIYEILDEKTDSSEYQLGMLYKLKDDKGNLRHVNSNYFEPLEVDLTWCSPSYVKYSDINESAEILMAKKDIELRNSISCDESEPDENVYCNTFGDPELDHNPDVNECIKNLGKINLRKPKKYSESNDFIIQQKATTLEQKLLERSPKDPLFEMKILCGLKRPEDYSGKNSFKIMLESVQSLSDQITALENIKRTLEFEIEYMRRLNILENI